MMAPREPRTPPNKSGNFTPAENALIRLHYPNYDLLEKLLPNRSRKAIRSRARQEGITRGNYWTNRGEQAVIDGRARGMTARRIAESLGVPLQRVEMKARDLRMKKLVARLARPMAPSGNPLFDSIRVEARRQGISFCQLDRMCGTPRFFSKFTGFSNWRASARALEILQMELVVEWQD